MPGRQPLAAHAAAAAGTDEIPDDAGPFSGLDEGTRRHFLASVRAPEHFDPVPLRQNAPLRKVMCVWAADGVLEAIGDEDKRSL